jgi:hypothetical protein
MGIFDNYWFGLVPPEGVTVAWGARAIDDGRSFGILHDRQSFKGSKEDKTEMDELAAQLNGGILKACQAEFARLKSDWEIKGSESKRVTLYDKGGVKVEGNTNASHGYFYVCAYMVEGGA